MSTTTQETLLHESKAFTLRVVSSTRKLAAPKTQRMKMRSGDELSSVEIEMPPGLVEYQREQVEVLFTVTFTDPAGASVQLTLDGSSYGELLAAPQRQCRPAHYGFR